MYKKGEDCKLVGYCNVDYAENHDTHWSTTRYMLMLNSRKIYCSKRQYVVFLSITKVKYRAIVMKAQENTQLIQ